MDSIISEEELFKSSELMRKIGELNSVKLQLVYVVNMHSRHVEFKDPEYCPRVKRHVANDEKRVLTYYGGRTYLKQIARLWYHGELYIAEFLEDVSGVLNTGYTKSSAEVGRKATMALMERRLYRDSVTGLYNGDFVRAQLPDDVRAALEEKLPISIVRMRIRYPRGAMKESGRSARNRMISHMAEILKASLKEGDWAARRNGDQFVLSLYGKSEEEASAFAGMIKNSIRGYSVSLCGKAVNADCAYTIKTISAASKETEYKDELEELRNGS